MIGRVPGDVELGRADGVYFEIPRRPARLLSLRCRFQNLEKSGKNSLVAIGDHLFTFAAFTAVCFFFYRLL